MRRLDLQRLYRLDLQHAFPIIERLDRKLRLVRSDFDGHGQGVAHGDRDQSLFGVERAGLRSGFQSVLRLAPVQLSAADVLPEEVAGQLRSLDDEKLRTTLGLLLGDSEIDALVARINQLSR